MPSERRSLAIVGAGLVGLATAWQLLRRRPGLSIVLVEKEPEPAAHQSSHNTGVIHAGLYYRPGSLRARLCREGKAELERFAGERGVPFRRCGKLIVALDESERERLAALRERAEANGVEGIEEIGPERMREIEPHVAGLRALHSPGTGIIDFAQLARALAAEIRSVGGEVLTGRRVTAIRTMNDGVVLSTTGGEVEAAYAVTCGGLHSDRLARMTGDRGDQRIVPFRGDYYTFRPGARRLVRALVNPVPDPALPFLGVHFTRRMDGEVLAGPNAVLAFAREGYSLGRISARDLGETLAFRGFWRLAARHWRTGAREMWRDLFKPAFVRLLQRYLPELRGEDLEFGPSGVRAQCLGSDGELLDDFSFGGSGRVLHVRNAPSPAATASLAIGRVLAERAGEMWGI